ncbi:phage late control D family protein [Geodermatophilus sp. URMC 62]|uniref:phage late control D family protein n=1 Tax=Geodermatophilus sp. URMC 62 TaxID=3423414 RepID=UPI00406C5B41
MAATSYSLTIDRVPAPAEVLDAIKQIEVEDHVSMADMMRIRLAVAVREDGGGWTVLDDALFTRLANLRLTVTVGTGAALPLLDAYVVDVDTTFSSRPGGSEMVVTAMDPTVLMHLDEKVRPWPNMTDSDVAEAIFSDATYQLTPVVESTGWSRQENDHTLIQRGSDIQFLQQLADRNGYECYVELNPSGQVEGHFHPPRPDATPQGTLTVNMGAATNVDRFRARYDMLGPAVALAATIDPDDATAQSGDAAEPTQAGSMGDAPATPAARPRTVLLSQLGMAQAGEVQRYAQSVVDRSSWAIVAEGELKTVAFARVLRAKQPVMVRGVGQEFSGRYYVERVLHTIDGEGSWTQRFRLRRNATGLTRRESFRSDDAVVS